MIPKTLDDAKEKFVGYWRSVKAMRSLVLRILLVIAYFGLWIGCSGWYWNEANDSNGTAFIYQSDLRAKSWEDAFLASHPDVRRETIRRLFEDSEIRRVKNATSIVDVDLDKSSFRCADKPIGRSWAVFYSEIFENDGFAFASMPGEVTAGVPSPLTGKGEYFKFEIVLTALNDETKVRRIKILSDASPSVLGIPEQSFEIGQLKSLLSHSICFLDDTPDLVEELTFGEYVYPFEDYLYFSAVTITTLGYGDILPNSRAVRAVVTFEALLGVVIIAAFVSALFWKPNQSNGGS